jgi:hypothetical protein
MRLQSHKLVLIEVVFVLSYRFHLQACYLRHAGFLFSLLFNLENGGDIVLSNVV